MALAASLLLAWSSSALADGERRSSRSLDRSTSTVAADSSPATRALLGRSTFSAAGNFASAHHDGTALHLPAARRNIDLVGELEMNTPAERRTAETAGDAVLPGQIADLAVYKNFAYLNSWDEPTCRRGGTFIVDISNPAAPRQTGFLPALPGRYHGEGAHVITIDTPSFRGDVLAVNNEPYSTDGCTDDPFGNGGFDLYDVTNPLNPQILVQGAGDFGAEGSMEGDWETANSSHSTFMWQGNDRRAYVVFVDNAEGGSTDVDIMEITNPRDPQPVGEFSFVQRAEEQGVDIVDQGGVGGENDIFLHDMVVKKIGDRFIMKADYWDAGYTTWDVTNPANPQYIGDSTFDGPDPLTGATPTEGNGHQGEFSYDNRFILAADEDFSPDRPERFQIATGPQTGEYEAVAIGGAVSPNFLEDDLLNGPTVYGGYGCDASAPIPERDSIVGLPALEPGEEAIVVLQRGPAAGPAGPDDPEGPEAACFPGEKAANGIDAGYDAVLLVNHHRGEAGGVFCGSGDFPPDRPIVTVCSSHEVLHHLFGYAPTTGIPYNPANEPDRGEVGEYIEASARFDGWGYTHLIRNTAGKMPTLDSYAIPEALNPEYAFGFGDLSVHEFATDPTEYVAYSSYYAGGMRVFTFGDDQEDPNKGHLEEQGVFIDDEGSNFWGVEQFTLGNQRYFAGSDRDYGLQIFRYTGPGAAQKPVCTNSMTMVPYRSTARVALPCSDANNNPLTESVVTGPTAGTLSGDASSGAVTYTHTASNLNGDRFTFKANDGTMDSEPATAQIVNTARDGGRCFNPFTGTAARESMTGSPFGDLIRGGGGNDVIEGQGGDDCLLGQGGRDQIDGDTGNDRLEGGSRKDRLFGGSGRDNHLGGGGNDHVRGGSGHDRARGGSGVDLLDGGSNNDRLRGGKGNDRLRGGPGRDRLFGDSGRDRLEAGDARRNRLSGGGGNDRLLAVNGKRDTVRCGKGRDRVQADRRDNVARDCEVVRRARLRN